MNLIRKHLVLLNDKVIMSKRRFQQRFYYDFVARKSPKRNGITMDLEVINSLYIYM